MNQNMQQPSFELPPMPAQEASDVGHDQAPAAPERNPGRAVPAIPQQQMLPQQPMASANPINPSQAQQPVASPTPQYADDADLIEKEWVLKAKQIVTATSEDPYKQNQEISRFRADYLKKRYNKDIKIEDA